MSLFACENVSRYYQDMCTIENINLYLNKGDFVSLLGTSGVGKTTLFNILSGVDTPDTGKVTLNDEDITSKPGKVSYMLQKDLLLPYKTLIDNVTLPLLIKGISKENAISKAKKLLPEFGLEKFANYYPAQLSGGMRQRAALLRTFLTENKVILLDEPFSALDQSTKKEMYKWYLHIVKKFELTTLFITHDIEEAILLSDRIYIMAGKPGEIIEEITDIPKEKDRFLITSEFLKLKANILTKMGK